MLLTDRNNDIDDTNIKSRETKEKNNVVNVDKKKKVKDDEGDSIEWTTS